MLATLCPPPLQDLSDCQLAELPAAVFDLTGLIELSLAGNQLQSLPADVSKLTCLQRLVLAGNLLIELPVELFDLTTLEGLWVHGNLLQEVPQQLGQLTKLKNLSLAGCVLLRVCALVDRLGCVAGGPPTPAAAKAELEEGSHAAGSAQLLTAFCLLP